MTRKFMDEAATTDVVWAAADRIGKASNAQDVSRICDYLINKHWFQTAGDLRVARQNTQEWLALEVPSRLKIAIQEELDASLEGNYSPGKVLFQDRPASTATQDAIEDAVVQLAGSHAASTVDQSAFHSAFYDQQQSDLAPSDETSASTMGLSDAQAAEAAAHAAAWEAYYAANGYYSYGMTEGATSAAWEYPTTAGLQPSDEVVEAQEVEISDGKLAESQRDSMRCTIQRDETGDGARVPSETWSCGQCTFINRIEVSFCEICCGHISLSPDSPLTAQVQPPTPPSLETEVPHGVNGLVVDSQASYSPSVEVPDSLVSPNLGQSPALVETNAVIPGQAFVLELPPYVTIPSPSRPLSPLYSPSAPDFESSADFDKYFMKTQDCVAVVSVEAEKVEEISTPVPVIPAAPSAPLSKVDYRALAFKWTPSMPSTTTTADTPLAFNSPPRSLTEFSF